MGKGKNVSIDDIMNEVDDMSLDIDDEASNIDKKQDNSSSDNNNNNNEIDLENKQQPEIDPNDPFAAFKRMNPAFYKPTKEELKNHQRFEVGDDNPEEEDLNTGDIESINSQPSEQTLRDEYFKNLAQQGYERVEVNGEEEKLDKKKNKEFIKDLDKVNDVGSAFDENENFEQEEPKFSKSEVNTELENRANNEVKNYVDAKEAYEKHGAFAKAMGDFFPSSWTQAGREKKAMESAKDTCEYSLGVKDFDDKVTNYVNDRNEKEAPKHLANYAESSDKYYRHSTMGRVMGTILPASWTQAGRDRKAMLDAEKESRHYGANDQNLDEAYNQYYQNKIEKEGPTQLQNYAKAEDAYSKHSTFAKAMGTILPASWTQAGRDKRDMNNAKKECTVFLEKTPEDLENAKIEYAEKKAQKLEAEKNDPKLQQDALDRYSKAKYLYDGHNRFAKAMASILPNSWTQIGREKNELDAAEKSCKEKFEFDQSKLDKAEVDFEKRVIEAKKEGRDLIKELQEKELQEKESKTNEEEVNEEDVSKDTKDITKENKEVDKDVVKAEPADKNAEIDVESVATDKPVGKDPSKKEVPEPLVPEKGGALLPKAQKNHLSDMIDAVNKNNGTNMSTKGIVNLLNNRFKNAEGETLSEQRDAFMKTGYSQFMKEAYQNMLEKRGMMDPDKRPSLEEGLKDFDKFAKQVENVCKANGWMKKDAEIGPFGGLSANDIKKMQMESIKSVPKNNVEFIAKNLDNGKDKTKALEDFDHDMKLRIMDVPKAKKGATTHSKKLDHALESLQALNEAHSQRSGSYRRRHPILYRKEANMLKTALADLEAKGYDKEFLKQTMANAKGDGDLAKQNYENDKNSIDRVYENNNKKIREFEENKEKKDHEIQKQIKGLRKRITVPEADNTQELIKPKNPTKAITKQLEVQKQTEMSVPGGNKKK